MNRFSARDKHFNFDDHRLSPLILLTALAHDLGKLTAFVPTDNPKIYTVVKHHDRESALQLARLDEFWLLTTAERDVMNAVVGHYHAERGMPLARGGQAIDDLRHALVHLLIAADKRAGHEEQLSGRTIRITQASAQIRSGQQPSTVAAAVAEAIQLAAALPPTAVPSVCISTESIDDAAPAANASTSMVLNRVEAALEFQAAAGEALAVANTPREMKTAATRALHADVAVATLTGTNTLIELFFQTLLQPGRVNGTERNINVGIRINDTERGAKLLVLLEQPLRSAIAGHRSCPARYFSEGGLQSHGTLSPLTSELLAALKAMGVLWNPHLGSTEKANAHNLYKLYGAVASRIFLDRALGVRKHPFDVIRSNHDKASAPFQPGAGYFIRVDGIPALLAIANLSEYTTYVIAGGTIFGARGNLTPRDGNKKVPHAPAAQHPTEALPANLFTSALKDAKLLSANRTLEVATTTPDPSAKVAPNASAGTTLTDIFGDIFGGALDPFTSVEPLPIASTVRSAGEVISEVMRHLDTASAKTLWSERDMENVLTPSLFDELRALPRPLQLQDIRLVDHPNSSEFIVEISEQGATIHA